MTDGKSDDKVSQFVTVFQQIKDWDDSERGDRYIAHGKHPDRRYSIDEEAEGFIPTAEPIAIIDIGAPLHEDDLGDWCDSHAGERVLEQYFPGIEAGDPTLEGVKIIEQNAEAGA